MTCNCGFFEGKRGECVCGGRYKIHKEKITADKLPELKEYQAGYSEDIEGNEYIEIYLGAGNLYKKNEVKARETAIAEQLLRWYNTYSKDELLWTSNDCITDFELIIKKLTREK